MSTRVESLESICETIENYIDSVTNNKTDTNVLLVDRKDPGEDKTKLVYSAC